MKSKLDMRGSRRKGLGLAALPMAVAAVMLWFTAVAQAFGAEGAGRGAGAAFMKQGPVESSAWLRLLLAYGILTIGIGVAVWALVRIGLNVKPAAFVLAAAGIMVQPHLALQLPGHRALGWLTAIIALRMLCGTGYATLFGLASAAGTVAVNHSPNGWWGVAQYILAGVLIDTLLAFRPRIALNPAKLALAGGAVLMVVGWITPVTKGMGQGVPFSDIWWSLRAVPMSGWARLFSYNFAFGAGAGLFAYAALAFRPAAVTAPARGAWRRLSPAGATD